MEQQQNIQQAQTVTNGTDNSNSSTPATNSTNTANSVLQVATPELSTTQQPATPNFKQQPVSESANVAQQQRKPRKPAQPKKKTVSRQIEETKSIPAQETQQQQQEIKKEEFTDELINTFDQGDNIRQEINQFTEQIRGPSALEQLREQQTVTAKSVQEKEPTAREQKTKAISKALQQSGINRKFGVLRELIQKQQERRSQFKLMSGPNQPTVNKFFGWDKRFKRI